jgi:hypothetical protein
MSARGLNRDRVTVHLSAPQGEWLNRTAEDRRTSVSDIIRRLIDETRGAYLIPPSISEEANAPTKHDG